MRVKGTLVRTRLDFLAERFGPAAPGRLLELLTEEERRLANAALPASWVPFALLNRVDETMVREFGRGRLEICRDLGEFSARRNLSTTYHVFVEHAQGDPQRLMANLSGLHGTFYDWGMMQAIPLPGARCRAEADYEGGASRTNCLTAVGFYAEALRQLNIEGVKVEETACQVSGASRCCYVVSWQP